MRQTIRTPQALRYLPLFALWLGLLRFVFDPNEREDSHIRAHAIAMLGDSDRNKDATQHLRSVNPEWDLMRQLYMGLGLANLALSESSPASRAAHLQHLDALIVGLLQRAQDPHTFLLSYSHARAWKASGQSIFLDGEVAALLAARQVVEPSAALDAPLRERINVIEQAMATSPSVSGESYPDEAWTFCNTTALFALRLYDLRYGTDHSALARRWISYAREHLVEPTTGLLISRYRYDGSWMEGPEGSSIFMVAHNLRAWDEDFATDQQRRAKHELVITVLGFDLAREWPRHLSGHEDIDSGLRIPLLDASPGASGMALLGAAAFHDAAGLLRLRRSLNFAALPTTDRSGLSYAAAGPMGNAVLFAISGTHLLDAAAQGRVASRELP
jgi:hypothetical protein